MKKHLELEVKMIKFLYIIVFLIYGFIIINQ